MQLFRRKSTYQGFVRLKFKHTRIKTNRCNSLGLIRTEATIHDQSKKMQLFEDQTVKLQLFGDKNTITKNLFIKNK